MISALARRALQTLRANLLVALLVVATLASCLVAADWGLPDGASAETSAPWAVDTIAPLGPLSEAHSRFTRAGSEDVIYPLFHYVVLCAAYAPYVAYAFVSGSLGNPSGDFPYGATDPASFFVTLNVIASLVSALMAAGIVVFVFQIASALFGRRAALWAVALTALMPPLAYYGMTSNLDVPYLFWMLLAFWQLVSAAQYGRVSSYIICGAAAGLAFATKDQAAGFFVSWPLLVPLLVASQRRATRLGAGVIATLTDRRTLGAALAALVAFALGNNLLFGGWDGFIRHLGFADEFYATNVATQEIGLLARQPGLLVKSLSLVFQMVGLPTLALAAVGLWLAIRERRYLALLLPWCALTYYVSIIAPTTALSRYLLGPALLCLPFAAHAIAVAFGSSRRPWRIVGGAAAIAAVCWQVTLLVHLHGLLDNDSRYAMERWVRARVPPGATIESSTQARYLPRLADTYRYSIVGNSFSAVSYALVGDELSAERLAERRPDYILILADSGLSGDPNRLEEPRLRAYYAALRAGRLGYSVVAQFATPTWLPYRQLTVGTQPTTVLLQRQAP